ncbi:hypothetical protein IJ732_07325 [bacterium]|nr:hypothetical protein [bacterium]
MTNINSVSGLKEVKNQVLIKESPKVDEKTSNTIWGEENTSTDNIEVEVDIASITGSTSDKKSVGKKIKTFFENIVFNAGTFTKHTGLPVAGELLDLSLMDDEKRAQKVKKLGGQILTPEESKDFLANLGLHEGDDGHTKPEQMKLQTIIFGENSKITRKTAENKALQEFVKEWAAGDAKENEILHFNTANSGSFDLRLGFGYTNVIGLHKTDDGYVEGYIEDVYDYDVDYATGKTEHAGLLKKAKTKAVQSLDYMAVDLQNEGKIKNYRALVPIKVKLDEDVKA